MRTLPLVLTVALAMAVSGFNGPGGPARDVRRDHHSSPELAHLRYPSGALAYLRPPVRTGLANVQGVQDDGAQGGAGAFSWGWLVALLPLLVWRARRRAALGDDQDAQTSAPPADGSASGPAARSGMRRPHTARSARAIPMRVPRLSVRN